jgi:hypothetical protein
MAPLPVCDSGCLWQGPGAGGNATDAATAQAGIGSG